MTCQSIHQLLPLFVEGDLPRRKAERVRRHVGGCPGCRGLAEEYRRSQHWLRAAPGPTIGGATLDGVRRAFWQRLETEPRPAPLWLAIERAWAALQRWAGQPAVAVVAVCLVVMGSVALTRMRGLGGSRLGGQLDGEHEAAFETVQDESAASEMPDDPEMVLAQAAPEEMADGVETGESEASQESAASKMRIEIQTQDPNVRIIWFTPPAAEPAVEN
jgi:hypothetical protein